MSIYTKIWILFFLSIISTFILIIATEETGIKSYQLLNVVPVILMQYVWQKNITSKVYTGKAQFNAVFLIVFFLIASGLIMETFFDFSFIDELMSYIVLALVFIYFATIYLNLRSFYATGARYVASNVLNFLVVFFFTLYLPIGMYPLSKKISQVA